MHFKKAFCDKMEKKCNFWFAIKQGIADNIKVKMEEDQGEVIKFIHKYRDEVTNEIKYCVAKATTGGIQKSRSLHIIFKQKEIDIDCFYELCKDQGSLEWYNDLVFKL